MGNVYVKYYDEEDAAVALEHLNGKFYAGRAVLPEYSPVTDFREGRCKQLDDHQCKFGPLCNFLHLKRVSEGLQRDVMEHQHHLGKSHGGREMRSRGGGGWGEGDRRRGGWGDRGGGGWGGRGGGGGGGWRGGGGGAWGGGDSRAGYRGGGDYQRS